MNFLFCITLNLRNGSVSDYVDREKPLANNYIFCILVGLIAYSEFLFFGMGETQMGRFSVLASYPIHMAFIIAFSNMWGILLHEWSYQRAARAGSVISAWFDNSLRIW